MSGAPTRTADAITIQVVARLRVAAVIGMAAFGSFVAHPSSRAAWLFVIFGLVGVPWSCAVLFAADRPGSRLAELGGPVGDVLALFCLQTLAPASGGGVLLGYVLIVIFALYTAGRPVAAALGAAALGLTVLAQATLPAGDRLPTAVVVAFGLVLAAVVSLFERIVILQLRAAAHSERLQGQADAILSRVADGVVVTDPAGRVLLSNPAAQRLSGRRDDEAVGLSCSEVLGLHIGERALDCATSCPLLESAEGPEAALGCEVWRTDTTGRRQPLLANASAVFGNDGRLLEVVHSLRDITRIKQAEEAKTLFLATASHELKTPLTVINGFAQTLLTYPDLDPSGKAQALEAIGRRAQELASIVDRLLLSSRIEAGRVEVAVTETGVAAILEERTSSLSVTTGREIGLELDPGLPDVMADEAAVVTIVDHLLDNAIKYSPRGGEVTVRVFDAEDVVRIDISDHGFGMEPEEAARCFDKFWQAESTDLRRFGGTGIGLYIVRSLVEAMNGGIGVCSKKGAGSTFTVSLPKAEVPPPEPQPAGAGESTSIREFMRQIGVPERSSP